jgi:hypothetical protein
MWRYFAGVVIFGPISTDHLQLLIHTRKHKNDMVSYQIGIKTPTTGSQQPTNTIKTGTTT